MTKTLSSKIAVGAYVAVVAVLAFGSAAFAAAPPTPVDLATSAGSDFLSVGIAIIGALIPLAVGLLLAKKALPWARRMLHV